jgi:Putative adhesin
MPTFDTPEPIFAVIELGAGDVRINAGDRADTVVEVRPSDPSNDTDRRTAEETVIEYADGRLVVRAPRKRTRSLFGPGGGSIDVRVDLPTESRIDAHTATDIRTTGRLGDSRFRTANGTIDVDQTGRLDLGTANGDVSVGRSAGHADVQTANGTIHIRAVDGSAVVKTANGPITIGEVTGDLRLNTASGSISIDRALASVDAKTATGNVRIGEVVRGSVALATGSGRLEIGVREGTAALLDAYSRHGTVRSELTAVESPAATDETVEVLARTGYGDIVVHRS